MLFLIVLAVATAVAAAVAPRGGPRTWARGGLAGAFVVAGVAHFVQPDPFVQHLPEWVPAARAMVYATGAIEIALGVALLTWASRRVLVGQVVAIYLVTVVPANIYVAVAGVDVDGQPGGAYPWVRIPFQLLFIAWALWSTRGATDRDADDGIVLTLPWAHGTANSVATRPVVLASRLELRRMRDVPGFLASALRIRRHFRTVDGAVALALRTAPWYRTFWTLSVWNNAASLRTFVDDPVHRQVTTDYSSRMIGSDFVSWTESSGTLPDWKSALAHLRELTETDPTADVPANGTQRPALLEV